MRKNDKKTKRKREREREIMRKKQRDKHRNRGKTCVNENTDDMFGIKRDVSRF